ncbi:hydroxymethylglutaryl-CoA lyase [Desulfatibacillum alkenivorans DSM 16219]|jgi:hydroxymethylglutaryl-CoA lyase|uniref:Hydroxymethylglutaryl-CoA lyase n=1 Tax=Desulfatibacillum alkenivorans DSM 16219 TaxID=1121393 RepID=A0A1M6FL74_9BACT|nr:pyruvate carboxyltransferase [Desulfatibacillum alkenivorans]SHI98461.1 hydroxymethylglutaryl-CoA lyase [Desulfatibacillum alkenivorans DSM 16219]
MSELKYPKKVTVGDITVRDGFQHEEIFIPTDAKVWVAEQLILAGFKRIETTNYGPPKLMPQFKDADELTRRLRNSKKIKHLIDDVELTAITIREKAAERAIQAKLDGNGPDRILFMVSTSESHHKTNSGLSLDAYWKMCEEYIPKAHDAGLKVCGTVSTIWGCPIEGPTELQKAVDFTKRWLDIGADDIEHADHDGSAPPNKVYDYFSLILDQIPDPSLHVAHFHVTRGWGCANVLAALQAGITHYESTIGGLGGQPANFCDRVPVGGTGKYYYEDASIVGLISTEDMVVMMDEMGIDTGLDVDRVLDIGRMMEKIIGRRLRSECAHTGRIPKTLTGRV